MQTQLVFWGVRISAPGSTTGSVLDEKPELVFSRGSDGQTGLQHHQPHLHSSGSWRRGRERKNKHNLALCLESNTDSSPTDKCCTGWGKSYLKAWKKKTPFIWPLPEFYFLRWKETKVFCLKSSRAEEMPGIIINPGNILLESKHKHNPCRNGVSRKD